jgi:quercetin dioxygenase-like cupin family protein
MINSKTRAGVVYRKARQTIRHCNCSSLSCTLVAFLVGILVGQRRNYCSLTTTNAQEQQHAGNTVVAGSVHRLSETPVRVTSHKGVMKQQFLEPFVVPRVAGYSVATIHPGQSVETHQHESMHEFFYVTKGTGMFVIDGKEVNVAEGNFLHIAPHEQHSIRVEGKNNNNNNEEDYSEGGGMQVIFSGVTVD